VIYPQPDELDSVMCHRLLSRKGVPKEKQEKQRGITLSRIALALQLSAEDCELTENYRFRTQIQCQSPIK